MGRPAAITFSNFSADFEAMVPIKDIAERFGVSIVTVYKVIRKAGASRERTYSTEPGLKASLSSRAEQIRQSFLAGLTMAQIGEIHSMTRERVRQILEKQGITRSDGGKSVSTKAKRTARAAATAAKRDARCLKTYGCTYISIELICGPRVAVARNPATHKYVQQMLNAGARGIEFNMTFPQWWAVWQASGKWNERGRGQGYVMARTGDIGPYAVGNVYICTQSQNSKDSYLKTSSAERAIKRAMNPNAKSRLGSGRGWTYLAKEKKPYQVTVGKRYIGMFATEQEARAAYLGEVASRKDLELQAAQRCPEFST